MKPIIVILVVCLLSTFTATGKPSNERQNQKMQKLAYALCGQLIDCFKEKQARQFLKIDVYDYADCFRQVNGKDILKILDHNDQKGRNLIEFNLYDIMKELDKEVYYAFADAMIDDYKNSIPLDKRIFSKQTIKAKCECYKEGVYRYGDIVHSPQLIERKGTEQYEYTPAGYQKNLVGWRLPCVYTLAYDGEENRREASDFTEGDDMAVYVIPVNKNAYVYIAGRNTKVFIGHIYRMPKTPYKYIKDTPKK